MLEAASALARDPDGARATRAAIESALARLPSGRADAALVFAAGPLDLTDVRSAARAALGSAPCAAVLAHAALAAEDEEDERAAVAVLVIAGADAAPFAIDAGAGAEESIAPEVESALGRSPRERDLVVVFADPLGMEPTRLADALGEVAPAIPAGMGATADRPGAQLLATSERNAFAGGACGIAIACPTPPRVAIGAGGRPFGDLRVATRTDGHWLLEIDGKPAIEAFADAAQAPLAEDLRRAAERVLLVVPHAKRRAQSAGDAWVARRVAGFAAARGAIALAEPIRTGTELRFALRDADLAREDLRGALASIAPASAALVLGASDRGRALFRHAGLEAAIVSQVLAPAAVAGGLGSYEVAPLGGAPALLAHAAVVVGIE